MGVEKEIQDCKGKALYGTREAAAKAARRVMLANNHARGLYPYECGRCNGHHLTF